MPLSRLRLHLAAWFALAFVAGLTVLNLALYAYLHHQSSQRLTRSLQEGAQELAEATQFEYREEAAGSLRRAAEEAFAEWPPRPGAFVLYDEHGRWLAARGDSTQLRRMPAVLNIANTSVADVDSGEEYALRQVTVARQDAPRFFIRASGSTKAIRDESGTLALWLGLTPPIVLLLSLIAGYSLSRRALTPIERLERAIAAIAPEELDRRLPVARARDEIDHLAVQFNGLLERLQRAQQQNRRFVQQAAHQIRTPLTLVLGEADLSLDRPRTSLEQQQALERIRAAAAQMKRRVDELFLLAQAEAGERPALDEEVELDGLALECADLMRGRAQGLGQRLELRQVEAVSVRGNEALLKEAVLELIENACRYSSGEHPIDISAYIIGQSACLHVSSTSHSTPAAVAADTESGAGTPNNGQRGLGLTIVRWIASEHGGMLTYDRKDGRNVYGLVLPALPPVPVTT